MPGEAGHRIHYHGFTVINRPGETVLESLLRAGADIEFSCRSGVCHRCMVHCLEGAPPHDAIRKLPPHQQAAGCLLACQCRPEGPLVLAPKSAEDMVTRCLSLGVETCADGRWRLALEPMRHLAYQTGQLARLLDSGLEGACMAAFVSDPLGDEPVTVMLEPGERIPDWLRELARQPEGQEFCLRGPLPVEPAQPIVPLPPDPALWDALGGDPVVRAVLTTFYHKVYADPELSPFFERVTLDRIIGKQFSFLKENIQGEPVYLGEQPRNTHNWMVINDALFDHRQALMLQAMREHGLDDALVDRWIRYEDQFRPEIVKYKPWPKRFGDLVVDTETYETCTLEESTVCDYCGNEILAGTVVRYHKRLGKLGCSDCAGPIPPAVEAA